MGQMTGCLGHVEVTGHQRGQHGGSVQPFQHQVGAVGFVHYGYRVTESRHVGHDGRLGGDIAAVAVVPQDALVAEGIDVRVSARREKRGPSHAERVTDAFDRAASLTHRPTFAKGHVVDPVDLRSSTAPSPDRSTRGMSGASCPATPGYPYPMPEHPRSGRRRLPYVASVLGPTSRKSALLRAVVSASAWASSRVRTAPAVTRIGKPLRCGRMLPRCRGLDRAGAAGVVVTRVTVPALVDHFKSSPPGAGRPWSGQHTGP